MKGHPRFLDPFLQTLHSSQTITDALSQVSPQVLMVIPKVKKKGKREVGVEGDIQHDLQTVLERNSEARSC